MNKSKKHSLKSPGSRYRHIKDSQERGKRIYTARQSTKPEVSRCMTVCSDLDRTNIKREQIQCKLPYHDHILTLHIVTEEEAKNEYSVCNTSQTKLVKTSRSSLKKTDDM